MTVALGGFSGFGVRRWPVAAVLVAVAFGLVASTHGSVLAPASHTGWGSVPVAARGPVSATLGAGQRVYQVHARAGSLVATNRGLRASFDRAGVFVRSGTSTLGLRLAGVGAVAPTVHANRVTYSYRGIEEWFANGPLGLEQGFTLAHAPATVSLALSGSAHPALADGGKALVFGHSGLTYRGLTAIDARGHVLRSWLALRNGSVLIRVDARHAAFPVRIDPFIVDAELTASDAASGYKLGDSVAISADGSTIVAGAEGNTSQPGAAYVFTEPGGGWAGGTETAKLTASDGQNNDELGSSVAISSDGSTIVVGAMGSNSHQGAAYVFSEPGGGWSSETEAAKLTASDGLSNSYLGCSVGISADGSTVVAGAYRASVGGHFNQGAAYVFTKPGGGWSSETEAAKLTASDGAASAQLGYSAALSADGSTAVVGAWFATVGSNSGQGAAYVFTEPGGGWSSETQTAKLTASDGAANDLFGSSVAISADASTVAVGAPNNNTHQGAAYVFMEGGAWSNEFQTATLTASDGAAYDSLGTSVALNGNGSKLVAGAIGPNFLQGAAYAFIKPGGGWSNGTETTELVASDGSGGDDLGQSVSIPSSGATVVAGLPMLDGSSVGKVDVFEPSQAAPHVVTGPVISGTAQDGQYIKLSMGKYTSSEPLTYSYQWQHCDPFGDTFSCNDIGGATLGFYKLTASDENVTLRVIVTATDADDQSTQAASNIIGPVAEPPQPQNTASPSISGTAQSGQFLTLSNGSWSSPDHLTYDYQWLRCSNYGASCNNISGATHPYYKLAPADIGFWISAFVGATDQGSQHSEARANTVGAVIAPAPRNATAPAISGTTQDGQYLKTTNGAWSSLATPLTFTYQWQRCDSGGGSCADIGGATLSFYRQTSADVGHKLQAVVTATDQDSLSTPATSNQLGTVTAPSAPVNATLPVISGTLQSGQFLVTTNGKWTTPDMPTFTYQWQRCDTTGNGCLAITNATHPSYKLTANDVGHKLRVVVTATDAETQTGQASSDASGLVS